MPVAGTTITAGLHSSNYSTIQSWVNNTSVEKPASIAANEVSVWDGAAWVRSSTLRINNAGQVLPLITTSTLAAGPPGSPSDKDIWIATTVDSAGTRWHFQYNSGSASTFKWEFIGGPPTIARVNTDESTASTGSWLDLTTVGPKYVTARAGDYVAAVGCGTNLAGGVGNMGLGAAAGATSPSDVSFVDTVGAGKEAVLTTQSLLTGLAAASDVRARYFASTAGTTHFLRRWIAVTPVRVS